jgi:cytochrome c-type biogenesis protein CcmH/NrfG
MKNPSLERIALLEDLLAKDPTDPFPAYALAIEYRASGDLRKAMQLWRKGIQQFPDYLPAYYPLIAALIEENHLKEAADLARIGVELALQQRNLKTASEIKSLLEQEMEGEL